MFGIGETELVIIVVFAFLLFGPDKLPGMGRTLGRVLRQFREASDGFTEVVQTNIMDPASEELEKSPKQRKREEAAAAGETETDGAAGQAEAPAPKRETFAERKARLIAERKAAEEAAASAPSTEADKGGDVSASTDDGSPAPAQDASDSKEAAAEPARTSAQDLYAMTSRKSTRMRDKEAEAAQAEESHKTDSVAEDASGEEAGSDKA